jgi:putative iron-dependent peroxidase
MANGAEMNEVQRGILDPVPRSARYLSFGLSPGARPQRALRALRKLVDGKAAVVGLGQSLTRALKTEVTGLRVFPASAGFGIEIPSTPAALWCWLRGDDPGELVHRTRKICRVLAPDLALSLAIDAFRYASGRDLSGYEDGTENPKGRAAVEAAVAPDGSSFVAVQQWVHRLDAFEAMTRKQQDHTIGRSRSTNAELAKAPVSAHVKRTAQESFEPPALILRRSMPWADARREGLVFVAFGRSYSAFEALLRRMTGEEDGVSDALFRFTRPVTGAYFWCPPAKNGRLDLSAIGL